MHHNDQAKYLRSPYLGSIMKSFYRRHHWNLNTDFFFAKESRFHWALLFLLRLPWSLVAQFRLNIEPRVQDKPGLVSQIIDALEKYEINV